MTDKETHLTYIKDVEPYINHKSWATSRKCLFKCVCWKERICRWYAYSSRKAISCWCIKINKTHWMTNTRLYGIRIDIKTRCYNKNRPDYKNYWWRGIKVCDKRVDSFETFYNDMWSSYKKWLSIERVDNNWDYCKENCKWITIQEQQMNKRTTLKYKWEAVKDICARLWLKYNVYRKKYKRGKDPVDLFWY